MEEQDYIAKAKSHLGGTVAPNETPPSPEDFPRVRVRETVLVDFESEDRKKQVFVLLERASGNFVAGGSSAGGQSGAARQPCAQPLENRHFRRQPPDAGERGCRPKVLMQRVTGIGGLFFRAKNPTALAQWYLQHLGVDLVPADYSQKPWSQEAGPTAFAPFPQDSDHFGDTAKQWMLNFRVRDLDAMVKQLRAAGLEVSVDAEEYPNGRFARLRDPEGNPLELWEPK